MNKNTIRWIIPVILIPVAAAFFAGLLTGKQSLKAAEEAQSDQAIEQNVGQNAEQDVKTEDSAEETEDTALSYDVFLNRCEMEGLGEIEGTIYVTGHKYPDTDTVASTLAQAAFLRQLGYDTQPILQGEVNDETKYVLSVAGLDAPQVKEDVSDCTVFLVDHSEVAQSAAGVQNARILGVIDHNGLGSLTVGTPLIYDARPLGSTSTVIWLRYRAYGLTPDKQTATVLLGGLLSNTKGLLTATTTDADREAVKDLAALAEIEDVDAFYREMYKASLSYAGMSDRDIFYSDYKEYEANGRKFAIGCVEVYDEEGARDMVTRMKAQLPAAKEEASSYLTFAQVSILHDDVSESYLVPCGEEEADVLVTAFGDTIKHEGDAYVLRPGISRKQVLVPAIKAILDERPKP